MKRALWLLGLMLVASGAALPALAYSGTGSWDTASLSAINDRLHLQQGDVGALKEAQDAVHMREWDKAIALLTTLTARYPVDADLENLLGFSYRMHGEFPQAFAHYNKALHLDPAHKGALEYEGEAFLETNQLPAAQTNLRSLQAACGGQACVEYALLKQAIDRYKARTAAIN